MTAAPPALAAIVCGFERGGTTLLGATLRRHPGLDSAFEGGLLLATSPSAFATLEPYASNLQRSYRLTDADFAELCAAPGFEEAYAILRARSPVLTRPEARLFDKTPRYLERLPEVLERMPEVPAIVLSRDPVAVIASWMRRSTMQRRTYLEEGLESACERYVQYFRGYDAARRSVHAGRLLHVRYESLCLAPEDELRRVTDHLRLPFDEAMLDLARGPALHRNLRGDGISPDYVHDYRGLPRPAILRIRELTAEARLFHVPLRPS